MTKTLPTLNKTNNLYYDSEYIFITNGFAGKKKTLKMMINMFESGCVDHFGEETIHY